MKFEEIACLPPMGVAEPRMFGCLMLEAVSDLGLSLPGNETPVEYRGELPTRPPLPEGAVSFLAGRVTAGIRLVAGDATVGTLDVDGVTVAAFVARENPYFGDPDDTEGHGCHICYLTMVRPERWRLATALTEATYRADAPDGTAPSIPGHVQGWKDDMIFDGNRLEIVPITGSFHLGHGISGRDVPASSFDIARRADDTLIVSERPTDMRSPVPPLLRPLDGLPASDRARLVLEAVRGAMARPRPLVEFRFEGAGGALLSEVTLVRHPGEPYRLIVSDASGHPTTHSLGDASAAEFTCRCEVAVRTLFGLRA